MPTIYVPKPNIIRPIGSHDLARGLLLDWAMPEREGSALKDYSPRRNNGVFNGLTASNWRMTQMGWAVRLTGGRPTEVKTASNIGISGADKWTVEVWATNEDTSPSTVRTFWDFGNTGTPLEYLLCRVSTAYQISTGTDIKTVSPTVAVGELAQLVVGYDGAGNITSWYNGKIHAIQAITALTITDGLFHLGDYPPSNFDHLGNVPVIRVWKRLLTSKQVASLYVDPFQMYETTELDRQWPLQPISPPTLLTITPTSGPSSGSQTVVITGTNLNAVTSVKLGGSEVISFVIDSPSQITAVTPRHDPGLVDLMVTNSISQSTTLASAYTFLYTLAVAQSEQGAEPDMKLIAVLRNVASQAEGATVISATDEFSANFPKIGANDGDATHINYGSPTGPDNGDGGVIADNGLGKSGWRSASAAQSFLKTSAADWNDGTQTDMKTVGDQIEPALNSSYYEQDFNGLTAASNLEGQDGWVAGDSTGTAPTVTVQNGADAYNGNAVKLLAGGANGYKTVEKVVGSIATGGQLSFRFKQKTAGSNDRCVFGFRKGALKVNDLFALLLQSDTRITGTIDETTVFDLTSEPIQGSNVWQKVVITFGTGVIASTQVNVYFEGRHIYKAVHDFTGVDRIFMGMDRGGGAAEYWIDEVRVGSFFAGGTEEIILDFGAAPQSGGAELTFNGETKPFERFIANSLYSFNNNDDFEQLHFFDTARTAFAQTFKPTETAQLDAVEFQLRLSSPPLKSNIWCELRPTSGGTPTATILARSKSFLTQNLNGVSLINRVRFSFPVPFIIQSGVTYALCIFGDMGFGVTNIVQIRLDSSAPSYSDGAVYRFDGTTWNLDSAKDIGFACYTAVAADTAYFGPQDADAELLSTSASFYFSQGFKANFDFSVKFAWLQVKKHTSAVFASKDRFWIEIQSDDGTGKPSNTILARGVYYDPALVTWTAYQDFCLALPEALALTAGTQYHLVIKANWALHVINHLDFAMDNSAATDTRGQRCVSDNSTIPVWTGTATSDLLYSIMRYNQPWFRFDVAISTDGISFDAYQKITNNPSQLASMANVAFNVGDTTPKRYWKIKATSAQQAEASWYPTLADFTVKALWKDYKEIILDFAQSRVISRVELYAHPVKGGCRRFTLERSADNITYFDMSVDADLTTSETRKKGAGAGVLSLDGTTFVSSDADYFGVNFSTDQTMRYVRIRVKKNVDEYARILEVRAFRIVDMTLRASSCTVSQDSDFLLRRIRAKNLNLQLRNDDFFLSTQGTDGGFNDQIGEGVKFLLYVGYKGVSTFTNQGVFYVDRWREQTAAVNVSITARDGVKLMGTQVRANYKTGYRNFEIIEYLANLAGIPSQDMNIDRTSSVIDFFATIEVNAYEEAQKVAEAAGFSELFFDNNGYMTFRAVGSTSGNTGVEATAGLTNIRQTLGPPVFFNSKMYVLVTVFIGGAQETLRLAEYNIDTGNWTLISGVITTEGVSNGGGALYIFDGALHVLAWDQLAGTVLDAHLFVWDGASAFTPAAKFAYSDEGPVIRMWHGFLKDRNILYFFPDDVGSFASFNGLWTLDMGNYKMTRIPMPTDVSSWRGAAYEDNRVLLAGVYQPGDLTTAALRLYQWNEDATFTNQATISDVILGNNSSSYGMGLTSTGLGYVYAVPVGFDGVTNLQKGKMVKITVPGFVRTTSNIIYDNTEYAVGRRDGDVVAYADGFVLAGMIRHVTANQTYKRQMFIFDEVYNEAQDLGLLSIGSAKLFGFRSTIFGGSNYIYGIFDGIRVMEFQVRRRIPNQTTPAFIISSDPEGRLLGAQLESGAERGGESMIINEVIVKSRPLITFPSEKVWSADSLPWGVNIGAVLEFPVELTEPCVPPQSFTAGTPTFDSGGAGTSVISSHPQQPKVTITITATGRITALSLDGQPLRPAGTLISILLGKKSSINRFGLRSKTIENDYIYDTQTQSTVAASVLSRFQNAIFSVDGIKCMALWNLAMFDRVNLEDEFLKINADFYVTKFSHDYLSQETTIGAVKI